MYLNSEKKVKESGQRLTMTASVGSLISGLGLSSKTIFLKPRYTSAFMADGSDEDCFAILLRL